MGDHGGRREKTGDVAALCQGDEHTGGGKSVFVPSTDSSCKAPNRALTSPAPPYPPCIGACSSMPPVSPKCNEATSGLRRPAQLCWVWPRQDYCLEPRPRKLSRTCVGLAKRSPAAPNVRCFAGPSSLT